MLLLFSNPVSGLSLALEAGISAGESADLTSPVVSKTLTTDNSESDLIPLVRYERCLMIKPRVLRSKFPTVRSLLTLTDVHRPLVLCARLARLRYFGTLRVRNG